MATRSPLSQRTVWTALMALVALAFWVVAFGVGWRAWLLAGPDVGIVAHVDAFGIQAAPWGTVAAILTLTTVVMGVGTAITRHLVDGPGERPQPTLPTLPEKEALEPAAPAAAPAALSAASEGQGDGDGQGDDEDPNSPAT